MATSSPFTFHCIICYDQFDAENKYPVVLPCGHTYICICCAEKFDRCPECRKPLQKKNLQQQQQQQQQLHHRPQASSHLRRATTSGSYATSRVLAHQTNNHRSNQMVNTSNANSKPERLSLPKNVVLISLMEATEMANFCFTPSSDDACVSRTSLLSINEEQQKHYEEEEGEEERIMLSTRISTGYCGTYSVANKDGLEIYPSLPNSIKTRLKSIREKTNSWERNVDQIVNKTTMQESASSLIGKGLASLSLDKTSTSSSLSAYFGQEPQKMHLKFGDRVQVVTFIKGWAKLARGYGYIRCDQKSDLIKVSGPVDRACCIEAMIDVLSHRHRELKREREGTEREVVSLMNQLRSTIKSSEDLTVIDAEAFLPKRDDTHTSSRNISDESRDKRDDIIDDAPTYSTSMSHDTSSRDDIDSEDLTNTSRNNLNDSPEQRIVGCGTGAAEESFLSGISFTNFADSIFRSVVGDTNGDEEDDEKHHQTAILLLRSTSFDPSLEIVEGAREWRKKNGRYASSGKNIDFRTGMSGHSGLTSPASHNNAHQESSGSSRYHRPLMSCHSALTPTNRHKKAGPYGMTAYTFD